ncbi:putative T7SS-secreted protein [Streptomyces sp. enrichment culture]|uniref:putative T7SS-secreted protein n=1 Tax=Streptomyces sp. enrichment culture TaxID=1795815 RepID=UPI003F5616E1
MFDDPKWPGLTFNPAKGDLHTIESLAYDVKTVGDELDELREMLVGIGRTDGAWEGEAARRFQEKIGELPKYLEQGHKSMTACAKALRAWHDELETMQRQARTLEAEAVEARKRLEQRNKAVDQVNAEIQQSMFRELTEQEAKALSEKAESASKAAQEAASDLEWAIENGQALRAYWEEQAGKAEKAIREAAENRPPDIGVWDKITGGLKGAWDGFKDFLVDNADLFSTISAGLAAAAIVVNVIPVGGQVASAILGAGSVAFAGAAMAGHWMGGAPMWKVGLDALGVIPGVGGVAKGLFTGGKALLTGGKVASGVTAGARTMVNQITNPLSTKAITWALGKAGRTVDPALVTLGVKGFSVGFGVGHLIAGGNGEGAGTPPVRTQPAPVAPGSPEDRLLDSGRPPVRTMPYPAATADKFHHTLAA